MHIPNHNNTNIVNLKVRLSEANYKLTQIDQQDPVCASIYFSSICDHRQDLVYILRFYLTEPSPPSSLL